MLHFDRIFVATNGRCTSLLRSRSSIFGVARIYTIRRYIFDGIFCATNELRSSLLRSQFSIFWRYQRPRALLFRSRSRFPWHVARISAFRHYTFGRNFGVSERHLARHSVRIFVFFACFT